MPSFPVLPVPRVLYVSRSSRFPSIPGQLTDSALGYLQVDGGNIATMAAAMKLNGTPNDLIQNINPIDRKSVV